MVVTIISEWIIIWEIAIKKRLNNRGLCSATVSSSPTSFPSTEIAGFIIRLMLFDLKHDQHNQHCQHCRGAQLSHKFSKIPQLEVKLRIYFAIKLHQILNIVIFINEIIIIKLRLPPNKYPQNGCLLMWIIGVKRWTLRMKGRDWEQTSKHSSPQLLKVSPSKSLSSQGSIAIFFSCHSSSRPWQHTHSVMWLCWIQSLSAFQTKPKHCKIDGGHSKTWPDQQKHNDKDKCKDKYKDNDNDNYI